MELHIAGGCGEHGRNCFHVTGSYTDFLVDCGLMAAEENGYPRLPREDIPKIQTVFLTHSHADHTGALPWLLENGFSGEVVASTQTLAQLTFKLPKTVALESLCAMGKSGDYRGIRLSWGRSGHCLGSAWFRFEAEGRTAFFSGDYTADSPVYIADPIRGQRADVAVVDCAYGKDAVPYSEYCEKFLSAVQDCLQRYDAIALPVPKYGRGLDLLSLLVRSNLNAQYYGDAHFMAQLQGMPSFPMWYKTDGALLQEAVLPYGGQKKGIFFISDPQLKRPASFQMAEEILASNGIGIMTGTVERNTNSARLIKQGKMSFCRYPVHLNYPQYAFLVKQNEFARVIPYHSPELACESSSVAF